MTQTECIETTFEITLENPTQNLQTTVFNQVFLDAIDSTLQTLGDSSKKLVYQYLAVTYGISPEQIPNSVETFTKALENIFGQAALLIEIRIIRALHASVPCFELSGEEMFSFLGYVESLRSFL
jgi:hypothetical protein